MSPAPLLSLRSSNPRARANGSAAHPTAASRARGWSNKPAPEGMCPKIATSGSFCWTSSACERRSPLQISGLCGQPDPSPAGYRAPSEERKRKLPYLTLPLAVAELVGTSQLAASIAWHGMAWHTAGKEAASSGIAGMAARSTMPCCAPWLAASEIEPHALPAAVADDALRLPRARSSGPCAQAPALRTHPNPEAPLGPRVDATLFG
ncbi:hypothetical protein BP6252_03743 [Coleophoma cylindrospora]|uniref:Uncharacterized protein n=1 Tax=Coleophoma cylindrospora TaxID=1849047 RepID=A0A3D8S909_9HELO|nr:hypothetical protein BP6252_03743 [Coleophoma cylindrospora]